MRLHRARKVAWLTCATFGGLGLLAAAGLDGVEGAPALPAIARRRHLGEWAEKDAHSGVDVVDGAGTRAGIEPSDDLLEATFVEGEIVPVTAYDAMCGGGWDTSATLNASMSTARSGRHKLPSFHFNHHPSSSLSSALAPVTASLFHITRKCRCRVPGNGTVPGGNGSLPINGTLPGDVPGDWEDVVGYSGVVFTIVLLVAIGGILSGLTLGYLSIDSTTLTILLRAEPSSSYRKPANGHSPLGSANGHSHGTAPVTSSASLHPTAMSHPPTERDPLIPRPSSPTKPAPLLTVRSASPTAELDDEEMDPADATLLRQKHYAEAIAPLRKDTHWLLVTLLLANTVVNETLPILFHSIDLDGWQAVLASTSLIVLFGEIVPQAVGARYGLAIGAFFAPFVRVFQWLLFPVAKPIALALDWALGEGNEGTGRYRRAELKELVLLHGPPPTPTTPSHPHPHTAHPRPPPPRRSSTGSVAEPPLTADEVRLLRGVLEMRDKKVGEIITPLDDVVGLELGELVDRSKVEEILSTGHSRIPVYHLVPSSIVGVVLVKSLLSIDLSPSNPTPLRVHNLPIRRLPVVHSSTSVPKVLRVFEQGQSHMAVVVERNDEEGGSFKGHGEQGPTEADAFVTLGIVTLEDVLEEILGEEILDETDVFVNVHTKVPVPSRALSIPPSKSSRRDRRTRRKRTPVAPAQLSGSVGSLTRQDPMLLTKEELSAWTLIGGGRSSGGGDQRRSSASAGRSGTV
ncbi:DUF21-domain-containing protein [Gonapodya prolifera JEL478]|uniref:DUF21-domain-containing protein n=1 Tax=Gonapodya prolifera (strain JEL478) TaxID=1344416 RepID=A0A139A1W1_GONPJ|nr:DUF21-domain-containing protein [Gonapodya prolifera JEL478]|eukprot:KXS10780.1 DUF21-domain-containing protein [Gonapodya prolifera JEL478]